jgi:HSP20 family molecular chaperone IbpA
MMDDIWENFVFKFGPFDFGFAGFGRNIKYSRTEDYHVLRIKLNSGVRKQDIRVRLRENGVLEIEWPRERAETIPVE